MGVFSFLRKKKEIKANNDSVIKSVLDEAAESYTATVLWEKEKQENGGQMIRRTIMQPEHIVLNTARKVMTQGLPCDYFFEGDDKNPEATLPLLTPLDIDVDDAVANGVSGKKPWWGSTCMLIAEDDKYRFFNYGCYPDCSSGSNIRQSKIEPNEVVFFGKARTESCIFHNYLVQVSKSAYGTELYLYVKDIETGEEKIYPWFGKYAIPTGRGSRYCQDTISEIRVDNDLDVIVIDVSRNFYINGDKNDEEYICNADTDYKLIVKYYDDDFHAIAEFPELNITQNFENQY